MKRRTFIKGLALALLAPTMLADVLLKEDKSVISVDKLNMVTPWDDGAANPLEDVRAMKKYLMENTRYRPTQSVFTEEMLKVFNNG